MSSDPHAATVGMLKKLCEAFRNVRVFYLCRNHKTIILCNVQKNSEGVVNFEIKTYRRVDTEIYQCLIY